MRLELKIPSFDSELKGENSQSYYDSYYRTTYHKTIRNKKFRKSFCVHDEN